MVAVWLADYNAIVQGTKGAAEGGLKAWKSVETIVKAGNGFAEIGLGGHSLAESIHEWRKAHYFCCVCNGIACSCFWVAAIAGYVPWGFGVWQGATQAATSAKGVTYTCRKITGGKGI